MCVCVCTVGIFCIVWGTCVCIYITHTHIYTYIYTFVHIFIHVYKVTYWVTIYNSKKQETGWINRHITTMSKQWSARWIGESAVTVKKMGKKTNRAWLCPMEWTCDNLSIKKNIIDRSQHNEKIKICKSIVFFLKR